ncbi:hypothetical protein HaLaN_17141 [Haematococcus lacustris]|uniref:Uncharacterized protein n=1 Tax=Haematococcus lacustris TaxID=44745 RepID=A0A699ZNK5_HAELA|nr:hypothetical protein HaLaN_17141 [Haematococcus lacustris]
MVLRGDEEVIRDSALRQYDPAPRPKQDLEQLVSAVEELPFMSSSSQFDARQLNMAAWSLGKLRLHLPAAAVTAPCSALVSHSASSEVMKGVSWRTWSNLLHGLATAGMQCSSSPDLTWLYEQAVQLLPEKLAWGAEGQSIGMIVWAMAKSGYTGSAQPLLQAMAKSGYTGSAQPLLQAVTAAISQGEVMRDATSQAWANLIWAASKLPGCREEARQLLGQFAARAQAVVPCFNTQDAVSSGHSQLASEPQLNSMAAALWRDMSGVVAHVKLQQLTHFDAGVVVNTTAFDPLANDSERAAFMREQPLS